MNLSQWLKIRRKYREKIKELPDRELEKIIDNTFKLYPQVIDISDGQLRGQKGFWSKNLSDAWHNAGDKNVTDSEKVDLMIWAVYCELHTKSVKNFKLGINKVDLSELSRNKIAKRYIRSCLESDK